MRYIRLITGLIACWFVLSATGAKRVMTEAERLEQEVKRLQREIKKQPGAMEKHCELVEAQLAAGDTTGASESAEYALKMRETPCLFMQRARIETGRGEIYRAARSSAQAIKAGLKPEEDRMVYTIDSLSHGGVMLCLQRIADEEKQNSAVWRGMGEIAADKGDSTAALGYYERAFHLGDSTAQSAIALLRVADKDTLTRADSTRAAITRMGLGEKKEVKGKINGLAIRMTIDTTATQSTISGVETRFMLKNGYLTKDDIIDNIIVVIKRLEVEGLEIRDIRLRYVATQESPVVLCPKDLKK